MRWGGSVTLGPRQVADYQQDKSHEGAEDREQQMPPLAAEAAQ